MLNKACAADAATTPFDTISLAHLRRELLWFVVIGMAGLLLSAGLLSASIGVFTALMWLTGSVTCFALVCQQTSIRLQLNRSQPHSPLYPDLGWANRLTLARGWLIAATSGFLLIPSVLQQQSFLIWIAAAAYSFAAVFDRVDGFIARKTRRGSLLGAELDTVFDALGLLVAPLLALLLGKIHVSYLLVSVAYYLFVLGIRFRQRRNKPVYPLAPSELRRTLAGFQMAYVAVVLWPPFDAKVTVIAGFGFMLPLLAGFVMDWCVVSGRLNPADVRISRRLHTADKLTGKIVLPAIRLIMPAVMVFGIGEHTWSTTGVTIAGLSLLLIVPGIAGRAGATLLLMVLAWTAPAPVTDPAFLLLLFSAIAILLLGCGRFSVWQADDDWVNRQDGA